MQHTGIEAKELRVGNKLQYYIGEDGCEWEETTIDWQDIKWATEENENFNKVHKPIPITEDILLRMGFVKEPNASKTNDLFIHGILSLAKREGDYSCAIHTLLTYPLPVKVKYVHQLQNLFHALTGQELEPTN